MNRGLAWFWYVVFIMSIGAVFFGRRTVDFVVEVGFFGAYPFQLLLNRLENRGRDMKPEELFGLPESKLLQLLSGCFLAGAMYHLMLAWRPSSTLEHKVGNFFVDLLAPWAIGSLASQIWFVSFTSMAAAAVFGICVTPPKPGGALLARLALSWLYFASLFTLWVTSTELNTVEEGVGLFAETVVKGLIKIPIDLGITVLWTLVLIWACYDVGRVSTRLRPGGVAGGVVPPSVPAKASAPLPPAVSAKSAKSAARIALVLLFLAFLWAYVFVLLGA